MKSNLKYNSVSEHLSDFFPLFGYLMVVSTCGWRTAKLHCMRLTHLGKCLLLLTPGRMCSSETNKGLHVMDLQISLDWPKW